MGIDGAWHSTDLTNLDIEKDKWLSDARSELDFVSAHEANGLAVPGSPAHTGGITNTSCFRLM